MTQPAILVLIINYNTSQLMQKLVDSIAEDIEVAILIVDNASTDKTYMELEAVNDKRVHLLKSKINLGFTGGINFGLKHVIENMPYIKYFLLFNPDALSTPHLIENLYRIIESDKNVAAVSPKILYPDGKPWYSGATLNINKGKVYNNP
ncbi:MAG: glycosyltransferase, partial [Ginsengibacter sp.]